MSFLGRLLPALACAGSSAKSAGQHGRLEEVPRGSIKGSFKGVPSRVPKRDLQGFTGDCKIYWAYRDLGVGSFKGSLKGSWS